MTILHQQYITTLYFEYIIHGAKYLLCCDATLLVHTGGESKARAVNLVWA